MKAHRNTSDASLDRNIPRKLETVMEPDHDLYCQLNDTWPAVNPTHIGNINKDMNTDTGNIQRGKSGLDQAAVCKIFRFCRKVCGEHGDELTLSGRDGKSIA